MKKIGLTGVIGSGKTTAAEYFKYLGIPVFIADESAKNLMTNNSEIKRSIIKLLGSDAYINGNLNKEFISNKIFYDLDLLKSINAFVHPLVHEDFVLWLSKQNSKYVIYEAALIFENNSQSYFDKIICIKTPIELIHDRLKTRENYSKMRINKILSLQIPQDVKCSKSDFCIKNISRDELLSELNSIHLSLLA